MDNVGVRILPAKWRDGWGKMFGPSYGEHPSQDSKEAFTMSISTSSRLANVLGKCRVLLLTNEYVTFRG